MKTANHFILTTLFLLQCAITFAQTDKEMEAIVNYQLAEEAYDNKTYDKALNYLEEAKKIIGNNPKILYLQIVIELEKNETNAIKSDNINMLLNLIGKFEKAEGIESFSPDKKLFIAKNKVLLKEKLAKQIAQEDKLKKEQIELEKKQIVGKENFENFTINELAFGLTVEEFQKRYPDVLPEKFKITKSEYYDIYHSKSIAFEDKGCFSPYNSSTGNPIYDNNINAVFVKEGKVIGFQKNIFFYNSKGQGDLSFSEASSKGNECFSQYNDLFFGQSLEKGNSWWHWKSKGNQKHVILSSDSYQDPQKNSRWKSSMLIRVIQY